MRKPMTSEQKEARRLYLKNYKEKNKDIIAEKNKKYREANAERIKEYRDNNKDVLYVNNKIYREKNKESIRKNNLKYKIENKEKHKQQNAEWRKNNPDKKDEWRKNNPDKVKLSKKKSYDKNLEINREKKRVYYQKNKSIIHEKINEKRKKDSFFRLTCNSRNLIRKALTRNGYVKNSKTVQILGCSFKEFKTYIESKFESWMTWENYGLYNGTLNHGWDIDHIIPLATAINEDGVIKLSHHTNLQPLCSYTNRVIKRASV